MPLFYVGSVGTVKYVVDRGWVRPCNIGNGSAKGLEWSRIRKSETGVVKEKRTAITALEDTARELRSPSLDRTGDERSEPNSRGVVAVHILILVSLLPNGVKGVRVIPRYRLLRLRLRASGEFFVLRLLLLELTSQKRSRSPANRGRDLALAQGAGFLRWGIALVSVTT